MKRSFSLKCRRPPRELELVKSVIRARLTRRYVLFGTFSGCYTTAPSHQCRCPCEVQKILLISQKSQYGCGGIGSWWCAVTSVNCVVPRVVDKGKIRTEQKIKIRCQKRNTHAITHPYALAPGRPHTHTDAPHTLTRTPARTHTPTHPCLVYL